MTLRAASSSRWLVTLTLSGLAAVGTACSSNNGDLADAGAYSCFSDNDCSDGMVCFADGCADPGQDIIVEVTPSSSRGLHAQDFAIDRVGSSLDFNVSTTSVLRGQLSYSNAGVGSVFGDPVSIRTTGESALIPGQIRRFETTTMQTGGQFDLPVASGRYTVVATPANTDVPPAVAGPLLISSGQTLPQDFTFYGPADVIAYTTRVVRTVSPLESLPAGVALEATALHATTGQALSQRVDVAADGALTLRLSPSVRTLANFQIRLSPKAVTMQAAPALIPEKVFTVVPNELPENLELGAYGASVTVTGALVSDDGAPLPGASVYVEGTVVGGGTFRSATTLTNDGGGFTVSTLPNATTASLTLVASPARDSSSGILEREFQTAAQGRLDLGSVKAPRKVPVNGSVVTFEGNPAQSVIVRAVPLEPPSGTRALPQTAEAQTNANGEYSLLLDPAGLYRIDFLPTAGSTPRASRFVTLQRASSSTVDRLRPEELPELPLSRGRKVTGFVRAIGTRDGGEVTATPYALVSFYRRVTIDGRPSSLLLAEGTADATGRYEVLLPSR